MKSKQSYVSDRKNRKKEQKKREVEQRQMKDCTFRPRTNASRKASPDRVRIASPTARRKRRPQVEVVRASQEPTFHPVVNHIKRPSGQLVFVNGKDKNVERLRRGRQAC